MEYSNRKRKGFLKGKLLPFYRTPKPTSSTVQYTSKVKPNQSSPSTVSVGFLIQQDYTSASPKPKPKVSFVQPADGGHHGSFAFYEELYGVSGDDTVDARATTYISSVQERFKLERVNSERRKYQDK